MARNNTGAIKEPVAREYGIPVHALRRRRGGEDNMGAIYLMRKLTDRTRRTVPRRPLDADR